MPRKASPKTESAGANISTFVKATQNIMRNDAGINGDAQRIEQLVWILFLKIYSEKEAEWQFYDSSYISVLPENCRWDAWAKNTKDGKAPTGDELLSFVNNTLFPALKNLVVDESAPVRQKIVRQVFEDCNNYMKDGTILRQLINKIDAIDFRDTQTRHVFGEIYEKILKDLQSAGNAGEFYTPRAVTDFMARQLAPKLGEQVADFACGTGGFLTSALAVLKGQAKTTQDDAVFRSSIYGVEKKSLPFLLCATNLFLHDIDTPDIHHGNSLEKDVRDYSDAEKFDVILMNPPFGGSEKQEVQINFPQELRSSETADLFMSLIMYRLKRNGRAAVVLPDGFLFGEDNAAVVAIKKKLVGEFTLHTIIRLPGSVFSPYTSITTNLLFFDNTGPTKETWFYRLDMPEGYKHFSKTKPMRLEHFAPVLEWWDNRVQIMDGDFPKAQRFSVEELAARNYNLDLCGFPHKVEEVLPPHELIQQYKTRRAELEAQLDSILSDIESRIGQDV